ncbi:MAG TPA: endonuclease/exonuclease/phosphatase family protein [Burkholderiales bacterium]|nr:endonuclease/exonuclease/phosphatase family protein [Burkholderiales bacterium]
MTVRVVTYNVHGCVGRDGRYDPERVIKVLRHVDGDVIALQELQWDPREALHLLEDFAHRLHYRPIAGPTLLRKTGHYGNALLTRLPLKRAVRFDLTFERHEPRGAIEALLQGPQAPLRVIATHLGLRPAERRAQMRRILRHLEHDHCHLTVLMGDLNEWFLWGRPLRWLRAWFGHMPAPASFPSSLPVFALDRIWVRPRERLLRLSVHNRGCASVASDHLPVMAELRA